MTSDAGLLLPRESGEQLDLSALIVKLGGRLIRHARYYIRQLAESYLTRSLVGQIIGRTE